MIYWFSLFVGLWVLALSLTAGAIGYALAHARTWRGPLIAACCALAVAYGGSGALLAAGAYTSLTRPSLTAAAQAGPSTTQGSAQSPQTSPPAVADQQPQPATDAWLRFQSDPQDYIGAGKNELWTLTESDLSIRGDNRDIQVSASGKGDYWQLEFRAPSNGVLKLGTFTNAERAPFVTGKAPGLDISGSGRGCNTLSGQFNITSLRWASSGEIVAIDVLFEQHCEAGTAALRGELWITTQAGVHKAPPDMNTPITF
jgi:hypothetical protein